MTVPAICSGPSLYIMSVLKDTHLPRTHVSFIVSRTFMVSQLNAGLGIVAKAELSLKGSMFNNVSIVRTLTLNYK